ncbi:hypothetical protein [Actinokineospora terrae]|uniref:hypothetical protein n=1 Tax=Actinokineospora terrae TaxID=155974 RepID=UPI001160AA1B|nr:hypothetical protein [Actinokineospora terrae]
MTVHGNLVMAAAPLAVESEVVTQDWKQLPQLPAEVRSLLLAQYRGAQDLPYRLPGSRKPSLATVYVRQDLGIGDGGAGLDEVRHEPVHPVSSPDGEPARYEVVQPVVRAVVRPPSRAMRVALDADTHLLVVGGPGQGKSTMSLRLAADISAVWLGEPGAEPPLAEPVVPLRLTARELARRLDTPFPQALADSAHADYGALLGRPVSPERLTSRVAGCRWLLLVDGLDEVADTGERDQLVSVLAGWAAGSQVLRVVLTTRPIEGTALAPLHQARAARYELQPFDDEALARFAEHWFGDRDRALRFLGQIRQAHLDESVRVPLLATIAAIIFEQRGDRPLPDNRYELYETYLKYLRGEQASRFDAYRTSLLEHLGLARVETDTPLLDAVRAWVREHVPDHTDQWLTDVIADLMATGPLTRRADDLRFLHHSFAEHLAATAQARLLPTAFDPDHLGFTALLHSAKDFDRGRRARDVLLHYTRLRPAEADQLLAHLHAGGADQHLLAARLLALHVPAGAVVVSAFLDKVRGWAKTTQYPGQLILARASRAAHHPGLADWLAELMRDARAPWQSRVEAAAALASRLRGKHAPEALTRLRADVDDTSVPVLHRLAAAEALSQCGSAEWAASERGLRTVLADRGTPAHSLRTAAVLLASLNPAGRTHAVEVLASLLDDELMSVWDTVELASGLVEIGEHRDRCVRTFRAALHDEPGYPALEDAASGLASLGHTEAVETVDVLHTMLANRRLSWSNRRDAAKALARLSPQSRAAVDAHLLRMAQEPGVEAFELARTVQLLAELNPRHRTRAAELLRTALADRALTDNPRYWLAKSLAELSHEFRAEAAEHLRRAAAGSERKQALAELGTFGDPYRAEAVDGLLADLRDESALDDMRCNAAEALLQLGPEFHDEVRRIASTLAERCDASVGVRVQIILFRLGADSDDCGRGVAAHLRLSGHLHGAADAPYGLLPVGLLTEATVGMLEACLSSPDVFSHVHRFALTNLARLVPKYKRRAVEHVIALLRSREIPADYISAWRSGLMDSREPRRLFSEALLGESSRPDRTTSERQQILSSLSSLLPASELPKTALLDLVADQSADAMIRGRAAALLARVDPDRIAAMAEVAFGLASTRWTTQWIEELATLGVNCGPRLAALMLDRSNRQEVRSEAASMVIEFGSEANDAIEELRELAADRFVDFSYRSDLMLKLASRCEDTIAESVSYHLAVLADASNASAHRVEAARNLARLDPERRHDALLFLQRIATSVAHGPAERINAIYELYVLGCREFPFVRSATLAVANDPALDARALGWIMSSLPPDARLDLERARLEDCALPLAIRLPTRDAWRYRPLAAEVEAVIRDVLGAPESSTADRIAAAVALASRFPQHTEEAAGLLGELGAPVQQARLGQKWWKEITTHAHEVVANTEQPWRERARAAGMVIDLLDSPPSEVSDYLWSLVQDTRIGHIARLSMANTLCRSGGVDQLRILRDDPRTPVAARWKAAAELVDYAVDDRAAGARVLKAIATDRDQRAALRWRAARDLMDFGERGREWAAPALREITDDHTLPVLSRVAAAHTLALHRPDLRGPMHRLLRDLAEHPEPVVCFKALNAIGGFAASEAARGLRLMAENSSLSPTIRLHCAEAMAALHRHYRTPAAQVARELAFTGDLPTHIRIRAARDLARWTPLCRPEARALLRDLRDHSRNTARTSAS